MTITRPGLPRRRDRLAQAFTVFSGVAIGALIVIVVVLLFQVSSVSARNSQLRSGALASCQSTNATRRQVISLWNTVLALPAGSTAIQQAAVKRDMTKVRATYAPLNCTALYGK